MIKAYHNSGIRNLHIIAAAVRWRSKNLLTTEQETAVKTGFPSDFYSPGLFVKCGLFIFTLIGCFAFAGILSIAIMGNSSDRGIYYVSFFAGFAYLFTLERMIRQNKLYHSGVDNALLYAAISALVLPVFMLFEGAGFTFYCLFMFVILMAATLRYADLITTAGSFLSVFALLGHLLIKFPAGKTLLPFAFMALAAAVYFIVRRMHDVYYLRCKMLLQILSTTVFYLGGNYLIVREGNAMLHELNVPVAPQIDFAPLFYFFTTIIPLAYIFLGLKKHDRFLLIIGLLSLGFSIFTYRHYFSPLTPAMELTIAGILLIAAAAGVIRHLHVPQYGLTDEPESQQKPANLEAILVAQSLGQTPGESGIEFGGGNFGGGGAGADY